MTDLISIVYVSAATHLLSLQEINRLLERARARNTQEGITGVLLYSDGSFMQCIEGPERGTSKIYNIIKKDPQHTGLIELVNEPAQVREFSKWDMAFQSINGSGMSNPTYLDLLLADRLNAPPGPCSASRVLLSKFWNRGRGPSIF
jgi:hypothetical protein